LSNVTTPLTVKIRLETCHNSLNCFGLDRNLKAHLIVVKNTYRPWKLELTLFTNAIYLTFFNFSRFNRISSKKATFSLYLFVLYYKAEWSDYRAEFYRLLWRWKFEMREKDPLILKCFICSYQHYSTVRSLDDA